MQSNGNIIDRIAFVMWSVFSYSFLAFGAWLFFSLLFTAEYYPGPEYNLGYGPKLWNVLWDVFRALFFGPAPVVLLGLLFRRFALQSKTNRFDKSKTGFTVEKET